MANRRKSTKRSNGENTTESSSSSSSNKKSKRSKAATSGGGNKNDATKEPIPVTILSGFLGSGKTSLLQHILTSKDHELKVAVIVNDMAELNIDGQVIQRGAPVVPSDNNNKNKKSSSLSGATTTTNSSQIVKTKKEVVTLENGCICCTLRGDLIREINRIQKTNDFDYVLIESTGIAEPQQVAESFCVDPDTQALAGDDDSMLWNAARLDTCVTVVDAVNFSNHISSLKRFKDLFPEEVDGAEEEEGEKSISELIVAQVEFANVLLLNKIDLINDDRKVQTLKTLLTSLNPKAKIIMGSYGKVDLSNILNTHLFSMEMAKQSDNWLQSLQNGIDASHGEADEYGVSSFVYRARKPFHPLRLAKFVQQFFCFAEDWNEITNVDNNNNNNNNNNNTTTISNKEESSLLEKKFGCILRSKGSCWIAGRDFNEIGWAQSGRIIQLSPVAPWYCLVNPDDWDVAGDAERATIQANMEYTDSKTTEGTVTPYQYGDRRQEIVFIGTNLQQQTITDGLNDCLLSSKEMFNYTVEGPAGIYPDPLTPALISCDGPRSLFMIARPGQAQHVSVTPGFALRLYNLALLMTDDDDDDNHEIKAVRVWLDKTHEVEQGVLLATLRPERYEQHALSSLTLLPFDELGGEAVVNRRIRIEVVTSKCDPQKDPMCLCEVHIMGQVEPLQYSENEDDDEDHDVEEDG